MDDVDVTLSFTYKVSGDGAYFTMGGGVAFIANDAIASQTVYICGSTKA
jgi:hypothetical protein